MEEKYITSSEFKRLLNLAYIRLKSESYIDIKEYPDKVTGVKNNKFITIVPITKEMIDNNYKIIEPERFRDTKKFMTLSRKSNFEALKKYLQKNNIFVDSILITII